MSAQPAYDQLAYDYAERAFERERENKPRISVVPGRGAQTQARPQSASLVQAAVAVAVVLVIIACFAVVRVTLSAAAVSAAVESQQLASQIEEARTEGSSLEVEQSTLSNPTHIKDAASALGMAAAADTTVIDISEDVVVTDEDGGLSLSGSVAAAASQG